MAVEDYLIQHALDYVWCTPVQDRQFLYRPARLTRNIGVRRYTRIEWEYYELPDQTNEYHVFQLGQIAPRYLNLLGQSSVWYSAQSVMQDRQIIIDIYDQNGRQFPRFACFFQKTNTRNLVLAVRDLKIVGDPGHGNIYVRFYSNAYYDTKRLIGKDNRTWAKGKVIANRQDAPDLLTDMRNAQNGREGRCYVFHNGWYVNTILPDQIAIGDTLEYIQDTAIKETFDVSITDLKSFLSNLDQSRKYLVNRFDTLGLTIDFQDDVDFFVLKGRGNNTQGVFYHRPTEKSVRMVTHRDYSLPVQSIASLIERIDDWSDSDDLTLRLHIRRSGYLRQLIDEHHRIKDLYRLDQSQIERAMVGANANVDEWQAASLENSAYTKIMRSDGFSVTLKNVKDAYGYNAISRLIGRVLDIPIADGQSLLTEPAYIFRDNPTTFYEYDGMGRVIDFSSQTQTGTYVAKNAMCRFVENFAGLGGKRVSTFYDQANVTVKNPRSFDAFYCKRLGEAPSYDWVLAVKGQDYQVDGNQVVWNLDLSTYYVAVRDNTHFLSHHFTVSLDEGLFDIDICGEENVGGQWTEQNIELPFAKVDVFLNNHPLIENLDYVIQWPKVVICNKRFVDTGRNEQDVIIRGYGVPDAQGQLEPVSEYGFVKHGLLSLNNQFDIRDDKNIRCVIEGSLVDPATLKFAEDHSGVKVDYPDGTPYVVDEVIVPMDALPDTDMRSFRQRSQETDQRVKQYLSLYFPEPEFDDALIVDKPYYVFSPFMFRVYNLLQSGFISESVLKGQYSDQDLRDWLAEYEWVLDYDPVARATDLDFIDAHPHPYSQPVELDIYQYNFLRRTAVVYFDDEIIFSTQVKVKQGWL